MEVYAWERTQNENLGNNVMRQYENCHHAAYNCQSIWCDWNDQCIQISERENSYELAGIFPGEERENESVLLLYLFSAGPCSPYRNRKFTGVAWLIFMGGSQRGIP
jgi:hypothetical protein